MKDIDRGTYVETVPENMRDLELLERLYPNLMPFSSVCHAKRVEPHRLVSFNPYPTWHGTR